MFEFKQHDSINELWIIKNKPIWYFAAAIKTIQGGSQLRSSNGFAALSGKCLSAPSCHIGNWVALTWSLNRAGTITNIKINTIMRKYYNSTGFQQTSNINRTLVGRCSWSIVCRRCSNYIFILDWTPGFNGLDKDKLTDETRSISALEVGAFI